MNKRIKKKKYNQICDGYTNKAQRDKNKALCKRYPFLIPINCWNGKTIWNRKAYDWTLMEDFPEGWWKAFGLQLCEELREELIRCNYLHRFCLVQIKEKYGCYDSETEILTEEGWKYFKDLSFQDKIATLNQDNNNLEYQLPTDIIAYKYCGKMYRLENRGISLCVTPNHNLYVAKGSYYNGQKNNEKRVYDFELTTPDKYFLKDKRFKKGCNWIGEEPSKTFKIKGIEYDSPLKKDDLNRGMRHYVKDNKEYPLIEFLRFLGFYIAEGCSSFNDNTGRANYITIAYNPIEEEELICKLITDIGYNIACGDKENGGLKHIYDTTLSTWLINNCGHLAPNKKVPKFIKNLPPKYIEEFLTYLYIGDGHKTETANILTTTSEQLNDDVQELLLKCGYAFRTRIIDKRNKTANYKDRTIKHNYLEYEINWLKNTEIEIDMSKTKKIKSFKEEWIDYNGYVYCVTVPNHVVYIRRNGKGVWCGNSLRIYSGAIPMDCKTDDIINDYSVLSENICMHCGRPDVSMIDWGGWLMAICEDCYNKIEQKNNRKYGYKIIPYSHWSHSESKMADERKFTLCYRKTLALDIGNWNEYVQIYKEFSELDRLRINNEGNLTEHVTEKHTRDLRDKAEKIRARWSKGNVG